MKNLIRTLSLLKDKALPVINQTLCYRDGKILYTDLVQNVTIHSNLDIEQTVYNKYLVKIGGEGDFPTFRELKDKVLCVSLESKRFEILFKDIVKYTGKETITNERFTGVFFNKELQCISACDTHRFKTVPCGVLESVSISNTLTNDVWKIIKFFKSDIMNVYQDSEYIEITDDKNFSITIKRIEHLPDVKVVTPELYTYRVKIHADLKELKDEIAVLKSFQDKLSSLWFDIENRVCVVQNTDFEYRKSWNITLIEEEHTADLSNLSLFMPYLAKSISTDLPYNFGINLNFLESTEFRYESFKNAMIHV